MAKINYDIVQADIIRECFLLKFDIKDLDNLLHTFIWNNDFGKNLK